MPFHHGDHELRLLGVPQGRTRPNDADGVRTGVQRPSRSVVVGDLHRRATMLESATAPSGSAPIPLRCCRLGSRRWNRRELQRHILRWWRLDVYPTSVQERSSGYCDRDGARMPCPEQDHKRKR